MLTVEGSCLRNSSIQYAAGVRPQSFGAVTLMASTLAGFAGDLLRKPDVGNDGVLFADRRVTVFEHAAHREVE